MDRGRYGARGQGSNRDADTENGYVDTGGEGKSDSNWEIGIDI